VQERGAGETAFVLADVGESSWRYLGVGRWNEAEGAWVIPDVSYETWRGLGSGRECSRRLPADALERARTLVDAVVARVGEGGWIERDGKRMSVLGRAPSGGMRVDGCEGGFAARTVSLNDT